MTLNRRERILVTTTILNTLLVKNKEALLIVKSNPLALIRYVNLVLEQTRKVVKPDEEPPTFDEVSNIVEELTEILIKWDSLIKLNTV